jgi:tetratricopeptide (TPR) repeat protein
MGEYATLEKKKTFPESPFRYLLKSLRIRKMQDQTQKETAESLGVSLRTYQAWEAGESLPLYEDLKNIGEEFGLTEAEKEELFDAAKQMAPRIHNLPFLRNRFFTGRESLLKRLDQDFEEKKIISLSGLGGIGKTQLALEYAHRCHPQVYRSVLWVDAENKAALEGGYLDLARKLSLKIPKEKEREVEYVIEAVKNWLAEHNLWLLILDNADDLELACSFLPTRHPGHVLLTTRSQIEGKVAEKIEVEAMTPEEGLLFLLRRSKVLKDEAELDSVPPELRSTAQELVEILGGHPLALDQAGAYIEETCISFSEYLQLYREQQGSFLALPSSRGRDHPNTVAATFELCFEKACERYPTCADVLYFCAFLHPDAIPVELFSQKAGWNLSPLFFNQAIKALRSYSLIKRDNKLLSLHHLVQAVIRDKMNAQTFEEWTQRVVQTVNEAFPEVTLQEWPLCEGLLPHVLASTAWIKHEPLPAVADLLYKTGNYLQERGQYTDAEAPLVRALTIREQYAGAEHPETAQSLHQLAILYWRQAKYKQAESCCQRALAIRKQCLGDKHHDTARSLNNLAMFYHAQEEYEKAEPLYLQALAIHEEQAEGEHTQVARCLNNLAALYDDQQKYEQVEPLYKRAIAIHERCSGAEHPETAQSLHNLAELYQKQEKYEAAESLYVQALTIFEKHLGAEHPDTASSLYNLADFYQVQKKYEAAEPLYKRALAIFEQSLGPTHPKTEAVRKDYAAFLHSVGRNTEAEEPEI